MRDQSSYLETLNMENSALTQIQNPPGFTGDGEYVRSSRHDLPALAAARSPLMQAVHIRAEQIRNERQRLSLGVY